MGKNIWIINQYISTPKINSEGNRNYFLAEEFGKYNYHTTLITGSFCHVTKRDYHVPFFFKKIRESNQIETVVLKTNKYHNSKGFGRIISWFTFLFQLLLLPFIRLRKPDIVIVSSISLLPILTIFYLRLFYKFKFILEIRDIWPLSVIQLGNYSPKNIFIKFLSFVEKLGYSKADYLVSVLPNAKKHFEHITQQKVKFKYVPNGLSNNTISNFEDLDINVKNLLPDGKFIVGYAGSVGIANAMEYFVEAALLNTNPNIVFCIVGEGSEKQRLLELSKGKVLFLPKVSKNQVNSLLKNFDLLYIGWRNLDIYKFGISANKIFDYLYAGKPILMSGVIPGNEVEMSGSGLVIDGQDSSKILETIDYFAKLEIQKLNEFGVRGHKFVTAERNFTSLSKKYIDIFESF